MICTRVGILNSSREVVVDNIGDIVISNSSADIVITGMDINGVNVTYSSGTDFPIAAFDPSGYFTTLQLGTYTVNIYYTNSNSNQSIFFLDSNSTGTCHDVGLGTFTINSAVINGTTMMSVSANNGTCL